MNSVSEIGSVWESPSIRRISLCFTFSCCQRQSERNENSRRDWDSRCLEIPTSYRSTSEILPASVSRMAKARNAGYSASQISPTRLSSGDSRRDSLIGADRWETAPKTPARRRRHYNSAFAFRSIFTSVSSVLHSFVPGVNKPLSVSQWECRLVCWIHLSLASYNNKSLVQ